MEHRQARGTKRSIVDDCEEEHARKQVPKISTDDAQTKEDATREDLTTQSSSRLDALPAELLFAIHIYAKTPALALVSRRIHMTLRASPTSIKVQYLLARWHEAYCYGFKRSEGASKQDGKAAQDGCQDYAGESGTKRVASPALPSQPSTDLLENGALPELDWSSRFLPVLPTKDFPYPLSNSFHRSASAYVLDYALRYRLTTLEVLHAVERSVLRRDEFGNIVQATGLWVDGNGNLHSHPLRHQGERPKYKPDRLCVTTLPKRLFQQRMDDNMGKVSQLFARFGDGPLPTDHSLAILLAIAAWHIPSASSLPESSAPFNSYDGLPLVKATFMKSASLLQFLLAHGAEPQRKGSLAIHLAIRNGWLEGLQTLVERDEGKIRAWRDVVKRVRACASGTLDDDTLLGSAAMQSTTSGKKRKLLDRAPLDHKMLKEAVTKNRWDIANWLRTKGIIPDMKTIQLIEAKTSSR